jgi:hypothetical protein
MSLRRNKQSIAGVSRVMTLPRTSEDRAIFGYCISPFEEAPRGMCSSATLSEAWLVWQPCCSRGYKFAFGLL